MKIPFVFILALAMPAALCVGGEEHVLFSLNISGTTSHDTDTELPSWGDDEDAARGNADTRLWPEASIAFVELVNLRQRLEEAEDAFEMAPLAESYATMIGTYECVHGSVPEVPYVPPQFFGPDDAILESPMLDEVEELEETIVEPAVTESKKEPEIQKKDMEPEGKDKSKPRLRLPASILSRYEASRNDKVSMHVRLKKRTLTVNRGSKTLHVFQGIEYSRYGIGHERGSRKTPLGSYTVTKEPNHRFGPVLRLSGYQGHARGILVHQDNTRDSGSNGCIHLKNYADMKKLFDMVPAGAELNIEL